MAKIPKDPPTFDLVTCRDMLGKLSREIRRLEAATDREAVADHANNVALTAWHMTDWVWSAIKDNIPLHAELNRNIGQAPQRLDLEEFRRWTLASCSEIDHCQIVGTAVKHTAADSNRVGFTATGDFVSDQITLQAAVSASSGLDVTPNPDPAPRSTHLAILAAPGDRLTPEPTTRWIAKIVVDGQRLPALPIFETVYKFWNDFINKHICD